MAKRRIAVVTGTSQGLGVVIARQLLEQGWQVHGTGRKPRPASLPGEVIYHQFDASSSRDVAEFWGEIEASDLPSLLVNNAGGYIGGKLGDSAEGDILAMISSVYLSAAEMTRGFVQAGGEGRVINIVSAAALAPDPTGPAYGAAKAAERYFMQSLQKDLPAETLAITNLYPSFIDSHGLAGRGIAADDLAKFVGQLADDTSSMYLRDVSIYPVKH